MAEIFHEISVDVARENFFKAIVAKQNDINSRNLIVTVLDQGKKLFIDSGDHMLVTLNGRRADGFSASYEGVINGGDGTVTVPLAAELLAKAGLLQCDISIRDSSTGQKLTTSTFSVAVERAVCLNDDIPGDENHSMNSDYEFMFSRVNGRIDTAQSQNVVKGVSTVADADKAIFNFTLEPLVNDGAEPEIIPVKIEPANESKAGLMTANQYKLVNEIMTALISKYGSLDAALAAFRDALAFFSVPRTFLEALNYFGISLGIGGLL